MKRSTTSASNIFRRSLCPGSERLETGLPEEDSDQANEGKLLHQYEENPSLIPVSLNPDQRTLLGISKRLSENVFMETAKLFQLDPDEPFTDHHEKTMWLHRGIKAILSGTCDIIRYYPQRRLVVIIDKKFGYRVVTAAPANLQLRAYACMVSELLDADNIVVAINQPRLSFEQRITMAAYTRKDIADSRLQLFDIWDKAKLDGAPTQAGEDQCRYCKAKTICEAYKAEFTNIAQVSAMAIETLSEDQLDQVLVAVQFADFIRDQARDEARRRIAAGTFTAWTCGKESQTPAVTDTFVASRLLAKEGIVEREFLDCCKLGLGKVEDLITTLRDCTGKEAKEITRKLLEPVITYSPRKASLTRVKTTTPALA